MNSREQEQEQENKENKVQEAMRYNLFFLTYSHILSVLYMPTTPKEEIEHS
jgi:hypothetical protein